MNKKLFSAASGAVLLALFTSSVSADVALRVRCPSPDEGARIFINDEFKAQCSADMLLPPGQIRLRVVQTVDDEFERVYENEFFMADNTARRINVELSEPRLTPAAQRQREEQRQRQEQAQAEATLKKANAGDVSAMIEMAERYKEGTGVEQDAEAAQTWRDRADTNIASATLKRAEAGDIEAMRQIAPLYWRGKGIEKSESKSRYWIARASELEAEKRREQAKALREEQVQNEIDDIIFIESTGELLIEHFNGTEDDFFSFVTAFVLSPLPLVAGAASDTVQGPTRTAKLVSLRREIAVRPAGFSNPDSMIAKAHDRHGSLSD